VAILVISTQATGSNSLAMAALNVWLTQETKISLAFTLDSKAIGRPNWTPWVWLWICRRLAPFHK